ncbi:MAG TPA: hypothetical protein PL124_03695 [Candidatus Cloacimonadota bacterium]|nr:hypothetical protein [Candidatus Cloacimonadota bacterium]HPS38493.1 hypothetical protein [Candidatus Cloacimonadota bacterium]
MHKVLVLLILTLSVGCQLSAAIAKADIEEVTARITEVIDVSEPIFIELTAGEWTPVLDPSLRSALLSQGADIREVMQDAQSPEVPTDSLNAYPELTTYDLKKYNLSRAKLVQISNEVSWDVVDRKSFLSYKQDQRQVNRFIIKQISLPDYQLKTMDEFSIVRDVPDADRKRSPKLRWFEPLFASLAVASLVFLLWTSQ